MLLTVNREKVRKTAKARADAIRKHPELRERQR